MRSCNASADGSYITSIYNTCYHASCRQEAKKKRDGHRRPEKHVQEKRKRANVGGRDNDNRKSNCDYSCTDKYDSLRHIALTCYNYRIACWCDLWKSKFSAPVVKSHKPSCGSTSRVCIPEAVSVQRATLDRVSKTVAGLASNRKDTFPAFLRFYMVSFLASISGADIPHCTTPRGAELPLRNPS